MISRQQIQEDLSWAYLQAVVAKVGLTYDRPARDFGIDVAITRITRRKGRLETIRKAPEGRQHVARGVSPWTRIPTTTVPPSAAPTPGVARGWGGGRGKSGGGWRPVLQGLTPLATC